MYSVIFALFFLTFVMQPANAQLSPHDLKNKALLKHFLQNPLIKRAHSLAKLSLKIEKDLDFDLYSPVQTAIFQALRETDYYYCDKRNTFHSPFYPSYLDALLQAKGLFGGLRKSTAEEIHFLIVDCARIGLTSDEIKKLYQVVMFSHHPKVFLKQELCWEALFLKHYDTLKTILKKTLHPRWFFNDHGFTGLMYCAQHNDCIGLKILLSLPSLDLDIKDKDGNTALMHAAKSLSAKAFELLVTEKKQNINTVNNKHETVLNLLVKKGNNTIDRDSIIKLVKILFARLPSIDATIPDEGHNQLSRNTPREYAQADNWHEMVKLLDQHTRAQAARREKALEQGIATSWNSQPTYSLRTSLSNTYDNLSDSEL